MEFGLRDRIAIVTGSGEGIGRMTVLTLAQEGAHVVVNDIDLSRAEKTANEARGFGVKALAVKGAVDKQDEVNAL